MLSKYDRPVLNGRRVPIDKTSINFWLVSFEDKSLGLTETLNPKNGDLTEENDGALKGIAYMRKLLS